MCEIYTEVAKIALMLFQALDFICYTIEGHCPSHGQTDASCLRIWTQQTDIKQRRSKTNLHTYSLDWLTEVLRVALAPCKGYASQRSNVLSCQVQLILRCSLAVGFQKSKMLPLES